ncbi:MAG: hypothetical protein IMZ58_07870 [Thermoplasmata archaeon]|nr:hypothetical protein [Thermoplasmata archaeon]
MRSKSLVFILFTFLFVLSSILIPALIINPPAIPRDFTSAGTYYHSSGNNAYFAVDHTMTFSQVVVDSTYVEFNNTKFNVSSPNRINISLNYINSTMTAGLLASFYAVTPTGTAHFNISGFSPAATYRVYRENVSVRNATANATGYIYFNNGTLSTYKFFEIEFLQGVLPVVTTNASTGVEETNATLHGTVTSTVNLTSEGFEYGLTSGYGSSVSVATTLSETLRPNAAGDLTELHTAHAPNWGEVDEVSADTTTYTYWTCSAIPPTVTKTDLYNITNTSIGVGSINNIIVYERYKGLDTLAGGSRKIIIKTGGNTYTYELPDSPSWSIQSHTWTTNPLTSVAWTWANINALQIGISFVSGIAAPSYINLTQAFVVVNYNYIPNAFSYNLGSLAPGQLYHFRAFATNSNGTSYGSDMTFLTKPNAPTLLSATAINTTKISLTWTKGDGANNTIIRQKKGSYPTSYTDGNLVYNGTGTTTSNASLSPGTAYRYRAWSYSKYATLQQWSDSYSTSYALTYPIEPTNANATFGLTGMNLNLTWDKGTGTNYTVILMKTTGIPSSPTDGTEIYNGTGTYTLYPFTMGMTYYFKTWSYAKWIVNPTIYHFSTGGTSFTVTGIGGLLINCFDENTHANLTFNVKVSNMSGSKVYQNLSATNTLVINASLCPLGANIQVIVSATGYQQRIYTIPYLYSTIFYLLNTYLPPETAPGNGTENCELRPYIDSMTITNPAVDAVITFTYPLEDMISVELYNDSLYGTYGGWIFVTSDNYTYTSAQLTVEHEIMDANTTMVRVNYYYEYCTGGVESALYYLRVVETIETSYTQVDQAVEGAFMTIKRYINASGIFVEVSSIYTDANGYVNIYLACTSAAHYKIFINKSGYDDIIGADFYPAPPNVYGQTVEKVFRIVKTTTTPGYNVTYGFWDLITFTGTMYSNNSIKVVFSDSNLNTTNAQFYTYDLYNFTSTLISTNTTTNNAFTFWVTGINTSRMHQIDIYLNHTILGHQHLSILILPINHTGGLNVTAIENKITAVFGSFILGFVLFLLVYIPAIVILILPGKTHPGFGIIGSGLWMGFAAIIFTIPAEMAILIPFIIAIGIILMLVKGGGAKL